MSFDSNGYYEAQDGDIALEPYGDESPDAMVHVLPYDKSRPDFWIERRKIQGLTHSHRYNVEQDIVPEDGAAAVAPAADERRSGLPVLLMGALLATPGGVVIGILIGWLIWGR